MSVILKAIADKEREIADKERFIALLEGKIIILEENLPSYSLGPGPAADTTFETGEKGISQTGRIPSK